MADEDGNLDPTNEETEEQTAERLKLEEEAAGSLPAEDDTDDPDVLKERLEAAEKQNQGLFSRTKKAEGFVKKDGKWVKKEPKPEPTPDPEPPVKEAKVDPSEFVTKKDLEQRDLETLSSNEQLQAEVKSYASIQGVSVKKAWESEYIVFQRDKVEKAQRADDASLGGKGGGSKGTEDFANMTAADFDLQTEDGRKGFARYNEWLRKERP